MGKVRCSHCGGEMHPKFQWFSLRNIVRCPLCGADLHMEKLEGMQGLNMLTLLCAFVFFEGLKPFLESTALTFLVTCVLLIVLNRTGSLVLYRRAMQQKDRHDKEV
ncbi:MAG: hypothetical protein ACOX7F_00780 [Eubacteriales bacterium]|jgi:hypothetical protein